MSNSQRLSVFAIAMFVAALAAWFFGTRASDEGRVPTSGAASNVAEEPVSSGPHATTDLASGAADLERVSLEPLALVTDVHAPAPGGEHLRGHVIVARPTGDEPYTGSGLLRFTRRSMGGAPSLRSVRVERGAFDVPALEVGESLALEHALLGESPRLGAVRILAPVLIDDESNEPVVVHLAPDLVVRLELRTRVTNLPIEGALVFDADDDSHPLEVRGAAGLLDVDVPPGVRSLRIVAPGYAVGRAPVPSIERPGRQVVYLVPGGRLEIALSGLDPTTRYDVELKSWSDDPHARIELDAGETLHVVEGLERLPIAVMLVERESRDVLDRCDAVFTGGLARVELGRLREKSDARAELHVFGSFDPATFEPFEMTLSAMDPAVTPGTKDASGVYSSSFQRLGSIPCDASGTVDKRYARLRPGLYSVNATDGVRLSADYIQLEAGATTEFEVLQPAVPERVDVTVRCIDATGNLIAVGLINATTDVDPPVSVQLDVPSEPAEITGRVAPGRVTFLVAARAASGGPLFIECGPFNVTGGESIDLLVDSAVTKTVAIRLEGRATEQHQWGKEITFRDESGVWIEPSMPMSSSGVLGGAVTTLTFRFNTQASRLLVVPPVHPELGPLASAWVEFDDAGRATIDLEPLDAP